MTDYRTHGQYRAAAESVMDLLQELRNGQRLDPLVGAAAIALSNLAIAEAIHRVAATLGSVPVVVNSTGSVTLDPEAVAEAVNQILNRKERNA